ncbi:MAG: carbamoyltransferase [Candidatus Hodarchaeota archaeon]
MPKRSITVLGLHDGHDAGAALVQDGKILAALQEERPRNIKHYSGTPEISMRQVFEIANVHPSEVDIIAVAGLVRTHAPYKENLLRVRLFERFTPFIASRTFAKLYVKILHKFRNMKTLKKCFDELGITDKTVIFIEHHLDHAMAAYHLSPWSYEEPVLIFTADGAGDGLSSTVNIGQNGKIKRIAESIYYDSVGNVFYSEITRYLGLKPWDHEYKVMGLAPYGKAEYCIEQMKKIIRLNPKNPLVFQNTISAYSVSVQSKLKTLLSGQRFDTIAAATQLWFEKLMISWIHNAIKKIGIHKIACVGGLFLNVKANKLIAELSEVEEAFFFPAAGDDGTPVGAALQAYHEVCTWDGRKPEKDQLRDLYFGPTYGNEEIKEILKKTYWIRKAEFYDEIDALIGELITKGKIIARCNDRLEWGPRALGNRSILADARDLKVIRKINFAIKHRDFWMPFAPSILEDRMHDYLINARSAPYMIMAFDTTERRDDISAGLHPFDQTCRPQTVNSTWNPGYRQVLESFQEYTGVGGLLNTSFNLHGYPIVCTPEHALWTLENSELDGLAIGNYLILR